MNTNKNAVCKYYVYINSLPPVKIFPLFFLKSTFQEYDQSVKQFGSRLSPNCLQRLSVDNFLSLAQKKINIDMLVYTYWINTIRTSGGDNNPRLLMKQTTKQFAFASAQLD